MTQTLDDNKYTKIHISIPHIDFEFKPSSDYSLYNTDKKNLESLASSCSLQVKGLSQPNRCKIYLNIEDNIFSLIGILIIDESVTEETAIRRIAEAFITNLCSENLILNLDTLYGEYTFRLPENIVYKLSSIVLEKPELDLASQFAQNLRKREEENKYKLPDALVDSIRRGLENTLQPLTVAQGKDKVIEYLLGMVNFIFSEGVNRGKLL